MSCPFSLSKRLSYNHQRLLLPPSWEQSGVCLGWASLAAWRRSGTHPLGQGQGVPIHDSKWGSLSSSTSSQDWSLHFSLIVLNINCLWRCWQVDGIKFEDPQKSFLGKWHLRKRLKNKTLRIYWVSMQNTMSVICLVPILVNRDEAEVLIGSEA